MKTDTLFALKSYITLPKAVQTYIANNIQDNIDIVEVCLESSYYHHVIKGKEILVMETIEKDLYVFDEIKGPSIKFNDYTKSIERDSLLERIKNYNKKITNVINHKDTNNNDLKSILAGLACTGVDCNPHSYD